MWFKWAIGFELKRKIVGFSLYNTSKWLSNVFKTILLVLQGMIGKSVIDWFFDLSCRVITFKGSV